MPQHSRHLSAPRVIATLAGLVHGRQSAADDKHNHDEDNQYRARAFRPLVFVSFCGHFVVLPHSQQIDRHLVHLVHLICRIEQ